jgi:hypothetical protein
VKSEARRAASRAARARVVAASVALGVMGTGASARPAFAQPNLPPPPPPPIGGANEVPSLPPPPAPSSQHAPATPVTPARRASTPPPPPAYRAPRGTRTDDVIYVEPEPSPVAVTLSPLDLLAGRLSGDVEVQLAPHHAVIVSANTLVFDDGRGSATSLVSEGFGFASRTSRGFGIEVGYHYWWDWARSLRGPFFGPSLVLGATSDAAVGDPTHVQGFWGLALDGGYQEVFAGGFTAGAGAGLELLRMSGTSAVVPRLLAQVGWSF